MHITIVDHLNGISSLLQRDMQRSFHGTSLTETRVHALWVIAQAGPSTQQQLSQALGTTPRSVSALVDGLTEAGYVSREPHPEDRRAFLVTLTGAAETMMRRMQQDHERLSAELIAAVDKDDLPAFERGISAVLARLEYLFQHEEVTYGDVEAK